MAKITITIEDRPDGTVAILGEPDVLAIYAQAGHAQAQTRAECYAMAAWSAMVTVSQMSAKPDEILLQ